MINVTGLIWDEWNREHLNRHNISTEEVEEVCQNSEFTITESYRKRIMIVGKTNKGRRIAIILSPEDRKSIQYENGIYYVITAFDKGGEL